MKKKRTRYFNVVDVLENSRLTWIISLSLIINFLLISVAQAIPAFARKYETECTTCHSDWPALNALGRKFKEQGYRMTRDEEQGFLNWEKTVPLTAMVVSRPYDKKDNGNKKIRAIHEIEIMLAGAMAKDISGFFEFEAEDEEDFKVKASTASLTYHPHDALNVQVSWGQITWNDPYDVYSDPRRLTANRASIINQPFGGADDGGRLRDSRQNITLYGRPWDMIYYSVSYSGVADDSEGEDSDVISGRLAWDIKPDIMVGLLGMSGTCKKDTAKNCAVERDFSRIGIDAQADFNNIRLMGSFLKAKDDNDSDTNEDENDAIFVEARYTFKKNGRPSFVPLLRLDNYETNDGEDDYTEITAQLSYYFKPNARGFVEYWDQDAPSSVEDDNRLTFQAEVLF